MGVKFFGQYLLEKNIITARQLIEAAEQQESKNLKFGEYAVVKGFLKESEVNHIYDEQRRSDMFFGEVAVKLGFLTPTKVKEILTMQKNDRVMIGSVLVEKGFITQEVLERELGFFSEDQKGLVLDDVAIPSGAGRPEVVREVIDITRRMLMRIARISTKVSLPSVSDREPDADFAGAMVRMNGSVNFDYVFLSSRPVAKEIARGLIGTLSASEPDEVIKDAVKEFCNISCGNIAASMAQKGKTLELLPPEELMPTAGQYRVLKGKNAVFCPLATNVGKVTLVMVE